jgi:hypothetical protein
VRENSTAVERGEVEKRRNTASAMVSEEEELHRGEPAESPTDVKEGGEEGRRRAVHLFFLFYHSAVGHFPRFPSLLSLGAVE